MRAKSHSQNRSGSRPRRWLFASLPIAIALSVCVGMVGSPPSARALPAAPPDFYGVSPTTSLEQKDFDRFAKAKIGTVVITIYWPLVQTPAHEPGFWNAVDGSVIKAAYAGVDLFPTFVGTAKHISDDPYRAPLGSQADRDAWQAFVRTAVERYGPNGEFWKEVHGCNVARGHCRPDLPYRPVTAWGIGNEPNHPDFWSPAPSPEEYAQVLRLAGDAIHDADPNAEVVTGGLTPGGPGAKGAINYKQFLSRVYQTPGIQSSFDGVDVHTYKRNPRAVRRMVKATRKLTRKFGDGDVPLWISEFGWSTSGPKRDSLVTNRKGQAKRLARSFRILTRMREKFGIKLAAWYTYKDGQKLCTWCAGAGLFSGSMKPKPAWKKYKKITRRNNKKITRRNG